jgi:hypothetical protein
MKINPFRPRSVDSIIDVFTRMEADLEKARAFHDAKTAEVQQSADRALETYDAFIGWLYDRSLALQMWADVRISRLMDARDAMAQEHFQEAIRANDMKTRIQALLGKRDD